MSMGIFDFELELTVVRRQLDGLCERREQAPGLDALEEGRYRELCRDEQVLLARLAGLASAVG